MHTKQVAEALEASIKHHEQNLAAELPDDVNIGIKACALCVLFHPWNTPGVTILCKGCPVFEKTGQSLCHDTPYEEVAATFDEWAESDPDATDETIEELRETFRQKERAEIKFLKSLRDPT